MHKLTPIQCFLHRIYLSSSFKKEEKDNIVSKHIFKPRKDCENVSLVFPIDWEAREKTTDRNWRMQLQGWTMFHPIMNFFDDYDEKEKEKVVEYFFAILKDWNHKYGDDPEDIVTSRMPDSYAWYDMSVGFRSLILSFFLDRIHHFKIKILKEDTLLLNKMAKKHITHLSNEKVFSLNNHGMFQIQGLMGLIQKTNITAHNNEKNYALNKMVDLITSQYDKDGIHLEHSPHYHFYALTTFKSLLHNDWYDERPVIKDIIKKAEYMKRWLVDPYLRPACVGDSILTIQKRIDFTEHTFSKKFEIYTENKQFVYSNFNSSGYAIFRSTWMQSPQNSTYLFFMGAYHRKTHKHRDCLSFEWFDNGEKIICDSGKYGYVSDKYRKYFLSNRAHNTVEIENFDILKTSPYGSALQTTHYENGVFLLSSELKYPALTFNRKLFLKAKEWIVVQDSLLFKRAKNVTQWFHIHKEYTLIENKQKEVLYFKNKNKELFIHCLNQGVKAHLYYGDEENLQGYISEKDYLIEKNYAVGFNTNNILDDTLITILALNQNAYDDALSYVNTLKVPAMSKQETKIDLLAIKNYWFDVKNKKVLQTKNNQLEYTLSNKNTVNYILSSNSVIKQIAPSASLFDIRKYAEIKLNITINARVLSQASIIVQLYTDINIDSSTKYKLKDGENTIVLPKFHASIMYMKLLFRLEGNNDNTTITFSKVELDVNRKRQQKKVKDNNTTNNLLPNIEHIKLNKKNVFQEDEHTYTIEKNGIPVHFYLNHQKGKKLLISLPGATDRQKKFYNFQRYTWSCNMDYSFMSVLDPTITEENDLSIGWFQGKYDQYALEAFIDALKEMFKINKIDEKDVIFFGSSAGGFSSLKLANSFLESKIVVINPQIYIYRYSENPYKALLNYSYPNIKQEEVESTYKNRLEVSIDFAKRNAPIYYYQNLSDAHHMEKHFKPYLESIPSEIYNVTHVNNTITSDKKLYILHYEDPESGHSPPNKENTLAFFTDVLNNNIKKDYTWIF